MAERIYGADVNKVYELLEYPLGTTCKVNDVEYKFVQVAATTWTAGRAVSISSANVATACTTDIVIDGIIASTVTTTSTAKYIWVIVKGDISTTIAVDGGTTNATKNKFVFMNSDNNWTDSAISTGVILNSTSATSGTADGILRKVF